MTEWGAIVIAIGLMAIFQFVFGCALGFVISQMCDLQSQVDDIEDEISQSDFEQKT